ncbi:FAD binding domain protein [Aspergillus brunneoviolaceus CBS 621.78]|uniref:FAD binding domain protein n=1 Tax=Aspergillus brunneoviolaceus CBS 621.78 TaxID=1450534 RepID=A0ACD1FUD1_9EURO|nr:FAD binding domain protein [Aspergillus brunneoviolaceus CBS 621.78]RAH40610.1 FAD binding domain protein [Aspergillus brunneoviolaceus CBS 621.78]
MSRFSLQGRTALVTGGARGCGLAFARGLAEAGANVAVFDVIPPEAEFEAIATECGVRTAYYKVDVSSEESLDAGFKAFQTDFNNALDICVPCAGINRHQPFLEFTYADHAALLGVNVLGVHMTAQRAARQMIANGTQKGSIVLVASMASHIAVRSQLCSAYCGSKGAVRAMCPAIAKELAQYNIRVNSISPGYVRTEMTAAFPHLVEEWKRDAMNGRLAEPEDIMGACVFLASDASSYMTGGDIVVDGGVTKWCNLLRYGTPVLLLDDRPDQTSTGKADGLQPKTIETLKQLRLADPLLRHGAKVYDISFWDSTPTQPLRRTGRKIHYPDHLVGAPDPYILLAHQGMLEDVFIKDIESRGGSVSRNSEFVDVQKDEAGDLKVTYKELTTGDERVVYAKYLVGCDGARSKVRDFIPDAQLEGEKTNASWGVLDGEIETTFPDLWSKVAVRSHTAVSILWIPRERNMTRLYVELSATDGERVPKSMATPEYVMARAREAMKPFPLEWKSIEWFGNYIVNQRVARKFSDPDNRIFIAGDAGHVHSALAAQGANTSMHDSLNLAWKINLHSRGLATNNLLSSYSTERRKIANDLIAFDASHVAAFEQGEAALARNFDENIRFIAGFGAEYFPGDLLTKRWEGTQPQNGHTGPGLGRVKPGSLLPPSLVTRYIDANPVPVQLDIPLLGQFRVYLVVPDIRSENDFLQNFCEEVLAEGSALTTTTTKAARSYAGSERKQATDDVYVGHARYTAVSQVATFALLTTAPRESFELEDLPDVLKQSRWTVYLDEAGGEKGGCTRRWLGEADAAQTAVVIVRPDGYVGAASCWSEPDGTQAARWVNEYFQGFVI